MPIKEKHLIWSMEFYENEYVSILLGTCVILEIVRCDYGK